MRLFRTPVTLHLSDVDSNSPAIWDVTDGINTLHVFTSEGYPQLRRGTSLRRLGAPRPIEYFGQPAGGLWMEAVIKDAQGTFYGYYHHEPGPYDPCADTGKTAPRIGAAKSTDQGETWQDLGIILEAPPDSDECSTPNRYFVGGVGDFTAILNHDQTDVYFFFSSYASQTDAQGIAIARMNWAERDNPVGQVAVWREGTWEYPTFDEDERVVHAAAMPFLAARVSWHDPSGLVDAYWGPSVHWNTHLERYVMLLNRAADSHWSQNGIYISFSTSLDDPSAWTEPREIVDGGRWYPQAIGLEPGETDKVAGRIARLFVFGKSEYLIIFSKPGEVDQ